MLVKLFFIPLFWGGNKFNAAKLHDDSVETLKIYIFSSFSREFSSLTAVMLSINPGM